MTIQANLFDLLTAVAAMLGIIVAFGQMLINQLDKRLDDRFAQIDQKRVEGQQQAVKTLQDIMERQQREFDEFRELERNFIEFKTSLPLHFASRQELRKAVNTLDESLKEIRALIAGCSGRCGSLAETGHAGD